VCHSTDSGCLRRQRVCAAEHALPRYRAFELRRSRDGLRGRAMRGRLQRDGWCSLRHRCRRSCKRRCRRKRRATVCLEEDVEVPSCCSEPTLTANAFGGIVNVTISGIVTNSPSSQVDAFYNLAADTSTAGTECPTCILYRPSSDENNACAGGKLSDLVVGGYPSFQSTHVYNVQLNLGVATAERLYLAFGDGGCEDNAGSWSLSFVCDP
jgi:hypothetical protein